MKTISGVIIVWLLVVVSWLGNVVKLASCDFESPYKAEVVHAVGAVFPLASIITVWLDLGK